MDFNIPILIELSSCLKGYFSGKNGTSKTLRTIPVTSFCHNIIVLAWPNPEEMNLPSKSRFIIDILFLTNGTMTFIKSLKFHLSFCFIQFGWYLFHPHHHTELTHKA
jgi:hypothetical protein